MSAVSRGEQLLLAGPPWKLQAVAQLDAAGEKVAVIKLQLAGEPALHRATIRPFGPGTSEIRLKLPRDTPPGTYRGEASLGGETHAVVVQVTPVVRTRVTPRQTAAMRLDRPTRAIMRFPAAGLARVCPGIER